MAQLQEHQREHHHAEVSSRQCLSGPHKDDIEVLLDGLSARSYASQGQTRTAALALKLAAREIHKEILGEYPILLLDDVLSELDPKRQEYVLNRIGSGRQLLPAAGTLAVGRGRVLGEHFDKAGAVVDQDGPDFDPVCSVICGENAQGKTNLLEAMVCLSTGKSHRTRADRELIRFEQQSFRLEGTIRARVRPP